MALSAATVWECRASGASDNNGGAFVAGASGTDYSQQNAAQLTLTDLATTGVVTTLTSVTGGFTSAMVGNLIHIVSGTNFTAGWYQITVFTNGNTVTLDRAPSTAAGAAGTGSVGGALATLATLAGAMIASNKAYCTGAFTSTATNTFAQSVATGTAAAPPTRLIGYGSTRGDTTHATLTLQTNTGLTGIATSGSNFFVEQMDVDCASLGTSIGINLNGSNGLALNCKVSNFTSSGLKGTTNSTFRQCEATAGTSAATAAINAAGSTTVDGCNVHDNVCPGILGTLDLRAYGNLVTNNSGASSDGIQFNNEACWIVANTCHNNGRHGIASLTDRTRVMTIRNNILTSNGGFGLVMDNTTALPALLLYDGNAFFNNTSGARSNADSVSGINAVSPYTNTHDVTLTGSPYNGPTTGSTADFGLNNTAGAGAACRAAGYPNVWAGNSVTTSFLDLGAVQAAAAAAGSHFIG